MKVKSIKINAILNIVYTISNIIFPLITFPYVSRILLSDGVGKVSFFTSISNYAVMFGSLGISTYGIRAVAKVREKNKKLSILTTELFVINSFMTIIVICLLGLSCLIVNKFRTEPFLCLINAFSIISAPLGLNWLYSGLEQYSYITKRTILFKTISLIMVFLLVKEKEDYLLYAAITAFSTTGAYLCNFIYAKKFVTFCKYKELSFRAHFKPMLLLFASILAVSIYTNLDMIMLGFISGDTEVGLYTVAVKVKSLLLTTVNALSAVLLPRLSFYLSEDNEKEYNRMLKKSISIILMVSIPLAVYFTIEAYDSIVLLGGTDYTGAVLCMQIIMPILLISGLSNITGNQILIPHGWDSSFMIAVVAGALVDVILNILLMPSFGCVGAAIATLLAELSQMTVQVIFAKRYINKNVSLRTVKRYILVSAISAIAVIMIRMVININALVNLMFTASIYFGLYGGTLLFVKDEILMSLFNEVFGKIIKRVKLGKK